MISFAGLEMDPYRPVYLQLADHVKRQILLGTARDGEELPSRREIAAQVGVNPNTVQKAYQELESEGVIYTVGGKGCFVGGRENAAEANRERAENELQEALRQARLAGVNRRAAQTLLEQCYGGEEKC